MLHHLTFPRCHLLELVVHQDAGGLLFDVLFSLFIAARQTRKHSEIADVRHPRSRLNLPRSYE